MTENPNQPQFLTIAEKRAWLAHIFRDTTGEYTDADKFKALRGMPGLAQRCYNV